MHLLVITFLLSINFINVYRPFPIGWDDLWAYMNYPKLISWAGELIWLGQMYFWQLYTWIGFLAWSQTFAFYLNSFAWVILSIVVYFALKSIIWKKDTLFSIPLLWVMIILMMPMTVFQLAKDMKLDFGLMTISVIALSLLYSHLYWEETDSSTKILSPLVIIWFLLWVAFSIKITSLLLLLGVFSVLFYKKISLWGSIWFFSLIISIFTYLWLWGMMNIVLPDNFASVKISISFSMLIFSGICFGIAFKTLEKKKFNVILNKLVIWTTSILLGFVVALLPWGIKNISEISNHDNVGISLGRIIWGVWDNYIPNYTTIYSSEELEKIKTSSLAVNKKGTTSNEDFGRYFGYEEGINNYLKLPWNLSFQANQRWEFTEISFIFFTLIPLIFLFLPYRKEKYKYPVVISVILLLLYYTPWIKSTLGEEQIILINPISTYLTELFSFINLPVGYLFIVLFIFLPFIYLYYTLDRGAKFINVFLANYAFTCMYVFLWNISSFWVVWYGIVMYFAFLVMITICFYHAEKTDRDIGYKWLYTCIWVVWLYVIFSVIPHGITNLKWAGYLEYKLWQQSEEISLMRYHPEYFNILFELNVSSESQKDMFVVYRNKLLDILDTSPELSQLTPNIKAVPNMNELHRVIRDLLKIDLWVVKNSITDLQQDLYNDIIFVSDENKNIENIFRVGTFLKYFISENNKRLFGDNLLISYKNYIQWVDDTITTENFNALNLKYILLDLNAATIDQDPGKRLTWRYEDILRYIAESDSQLIEADSICLKVALEDYQKDENIEEFMKVAGVNYGTNTQKREKKLACLNSVYSHIEKNEISANSYPYLAWYKRVVDEMVLNSAEPRTIQEIYTVLNQNIPQGYKALFKIPDLIEE